MKRGIFYVQILLLTLCVILLYAFAQHKNKQEKLEEIKVDFIENKFDFLNTEMVNKLLIQSEKDLLTKQKSSINLHELERKVQENEMVESAEVFITPKGKLRVTVVQRQPIVRISDGVSPYYLDRQGLAMPLSPNYSVRVPLVTGVKSEKMEEEIYYLINELDKSDFYKKQVIGIHRKINGDFLLSTRIGKHKVLLGKLENVRKKLKKLEVFYKNQWDLESINKYKLINLKYDHQVVCSK